MKAPELKDRLEESEKLIQEMTVTWEEKLRKTEEIAQVTATIICYNLFCLDCHFVYVWMFCSSCSITPSKHRRRNKLLNNFSRCIFFAQERQKQLESLGISLQSSGIKVGEDKCFLVNLNADPALNELLVYYLKVMHKHFILFLEFCILCEYYFNSR